MVSITGRMRVVVSGVFVGDTYERPGGRCRGRTRVADMSASTYRDCRGRVLPGHRSHLDPGAAVLELRDIDKPVQVTYGSDDVQTATGGTR